MDGDACFFRYETLFLRRRKNREGERETLRPDDPQGRHGCTPGRSDDDDAEAFRSRLLAQEAHDHNLLHLLHLLHHFHQRMAGRRPQEICERWLSDWPGAQRETVFAFIIFFLALQRHSQWLAPWHCSRVRPRGAGHRGGEEKTKEQNECSQVIQAEVL